MDAAAEIGKDSVYKHHIQAECWPKPSRETKLSGANGDREIFILPVQLTTSRIGNPVNPCFAISHDITYIHTIDYIHTAGEIMIFSLRRQQR